MSTSDQGFVLEPQAAAILTQFDIPYPEHDLAHDAQEAVQIADGLGYPVVLKVVSPDVLHKSDVGGVAVGLADADQVRSGYAELLRQVQSRVDRLRLEGVLVCKQAPPGLELIVGAMEDMTFGPVVMFGLGGVFAEILKDVAFRLAPLRRQDAEEMVREIRGYALLQGARGQARRDVEALVDLVLAVSQLVSARPDIRELDLNPVRLYEKGLMVLDVRLIAKELVPAGAAQPA